MKIEILKFEISDFWNFLFRNFLLCEVPLNGIDRHYTISKIRNLCHKISCFGCMCNVDHYHKRKFIKGNFENQKFQNFNFQKFKIWFSQFQFFEIWNFQKRKFRQKSLKLWPNLLRLDHSLTEPPILIKKYNVFIIIW